MTNEQLVEIEHLRERLRYDPETGKLYWRFHHSMPVKWNSRWAGKEAFTTTNNFGYKTGAVNARRLSAHRAAWAIVHGYWPKRLDHINQIPDDNRLENLREVTQAENMHNISINRKNTSGVMGVHWNKKRSKWRAQIQFGYKVKMLGEFDKFDDAVFARRKAEAELGFSELHGKSAKKYTTKRSAA